MLRRDILKLFGLAAAVPLVAKTIRSREPDTVLALDPRPTRTQYARVDLSAIRDANVLQRFDGYAGVPITTFRGVPIRVVDKLG